MRWVLAWLMLLSGFVWAQDGAALRLCYEDSDSFPWVMRDGSGLNITLIQQTALRLKQPLHWVARPWRRCLAGLASGAYDGAFAASYQPERAKLGRYPEDAQGQVDGSRRLHHSQYALYFRRHHPVQWDGQKLVVDGPVGSLSGFSIAAVLHRLGATVDESSRDSKALLSMLASQRFPAVAMQSIRADHILAQNTQLAGQLQKHPLALQENDYFLIFSHVFYQQNPQRAEAFWNELRTVRESSEYQAQAQSYLDSL